MQFVIVPVDLVRLLTHRFPTRIIRGRPDRHGDSFQALAGLKTRGTDDKDQEASEDACECIPDQKNMLKDSTMFYHCRGGDDHMNFPIRSLGVYYLIVPLRVLVVSTSRVSPTHYPR